MNRDTLSEPGAPVQKHTIVKTFVLHLLPGVLFIPVFILVSGFANRQGLPIHMAASLITFIVVIIPFQLGYLFLQGRKQSGKFTLQGIVLFRERMPWWQYLSIGLPALIWAAFIFQVLAPTIDNFFIQRFFGWMPDEFYIDAFVGSASSYSRPVLLATGGAFIILIGIIVPAVEELYFRGYLMPRIPLSGLWAPLLNIFLFSLYHLWSPWQIATRLLAMTPFYLAVWWKKNVYFGILWHVVANILSGVSLMAVVLNIA